MTPPRRRGRAGVCLALGVLMLSCDSEPLLSNCDATETAVDEQALTRKCFPQSLDPVDEPQSPDYGRVECLILEAFTNPVDCACDDPGYRRPTPEQDAFARSQLKQNGACPDACCGDPCCTPCCEKLCFCEFLQFSGEELAACQDRLPDAPEPVGGWCYLEPDAGFGEPSRTDFCQSGERYLLRILPHGGVDHTYVFACQSEAF